jgi:quercetin dioxygenase-like cupin family protein
MADAQPDLVTTSITDWECTMQKQSLPALVRQHLGTALTAASGRSAHAVYGGHEHVLRQTLIALRAGTSLDEHENPGEATIQVLHGRARSLPVRIAGTAHPAT